LKKPAAKVAAAAPAASATAAKPKKAPVAAGNDEWEEF